MIMLLNPEHITEWASSFFSPHRIMDYVFKVETMFMSLIRCEKLLVWGATLCLVNSYPWPLISELNFPSFVFESNVRFIHFFSLKLQIRNNFLSSHPMNTYDLSLNDQFSMSYRKLTIYYIYEAFFHAIEANYPFENE